MKLRHIPNLITIARLILLLPFLYTLLNNNYQASFYIFFFAGFSDGLDGYLARLLNQTSKLGILLDPIADKLLIASVIIVLIETRVITHIHVIPAIIILLREIAISGLREFLANYNEKVPVTFIAKIKTTIQMISLSILILSVGFDFNNTIWDAGLVMLWISAIFTLYSGYSYIKKGLTII